MCEPSAYDSYEPGADRKCRYLCQPGGGGLFSGERLATRVLDRTAAVGQARVNVNRVRAAGLARHPRSVVLVGPGHDEDPR